MCFSAKLRFECGIVHRLRVILQHIILTSGRRLKAPFTDPPNVYLIVVAGDDLLIGSGSRLDIENVNLIATLLTHAEPQGYWRELGQQFAEDVESLLDRHLLAGLVNAPWVRTGDAKIADDTEFFNALQELVAYVFEESVRIKKKSRIYSSRCQDIPAKSSHGILEEMQSLLKKYRTEIVRQSCLLDKGDRR